MFTGIVEEVGTVAELTTDATGGHLRIACAPAFLEKLQVSASVSVSGCCLTVTKRDDTTFWCDLAPETLNRTGFRRLSTGAHVNLEAPLTMGTPLGGHIVQGHVDGTGTFIGLPTAGEDNYWLDVDVPENLTRYLVEKGSVAIEGISLTVAAIQGRRLRIAIISYTTEHTNLKTLAPGDPVNIECDILAKYVERLLTERTIAVPTTSNKESRTRMTLERLLEEGF